MNIIFLNRLTNLARAAVPLLLIAVSVMVAQQPRLVARPPIAGAVLFDLTVSIPFIYWLLIRRTRIPQLTVVPLAVFGFVLATLILPASGWLNLLKTLVLPAVELSVLIYAGYILLTARKTFKARRAIGYDAAESLREALAAGFPVAAAGRAVAFELTIIYYALLKWRGQPTSRQSFTYHRQNGSRALLAVLIFLIVAETLAVHLVLATWSPAAAWILTGLSLYFVLQLFAHLKAVAWRPLQLGEKRLFIRCGILGDAAAEFEEIKNVRLLQPPLEKEPDAVTLTAAARLTLPNVRIEFARPQNLNGIYGLRKNFRIIYLAVDNGEDFAAEIGKNL